MSGPALIHWRLFDEGEVVLEADIPADDDDALERFHDDATRVTAERHPEWLAR